LGWGEGRVVARVFEMEMGLWICCGGEWGEKRRYFAAVGELRGHRGGRRGVENFGAG
jgi:hypothetical protein